MVIGLCEKISPTPRVMLQEPASSTCGSDAPIPFSHARVDDVPPVFLNSIVPTDPFHTPRNHVLAINEFPSASFAALSRSALRFLFSKMLCRLWANIVICRFSTPVNQYPKLPPAAANTGYAQSDSLLKKGRISIPSCQKRTAMPRFHRRH